MLTTFQEALYSFWIELLFSCFCNPPPHLLSLPTFCLYCLSPTILSYRVTAWAQLGAIRLLLAVSLHMDLCILDPLALCGHSDTTRLSVLGQRREALCMCPVVPAFSQARLGLPENKGIPRLDHWGEAILGRVTQRASRRVIFWILQANNFPIIFYRCVSSSPDITGIQVELWLTKRGATLGGPVLFEKLHAQKCTCPRRASCNAPGCHPGGQVFGH